MQASGRESIRKNCVNNLEEISTMFTFAILEVRPMISQSISPGYSPISISLWVWKTDTMEWQDFLETWLASALGTVQCEEALNSKNLRGQVPTEGHTAQSKALLKILNKL